MTAVGVDAEIEDADGGEVDGVVFDLFGGAGGAEGELLAEDFAEVVGRGAGEDGELLGAFGGAVDDVEVDLAEVLGGVEEEADALGAGGGGAPAGGEARGEGVLDGEEVVFGGDFDAGEVFEVEALRGGGARGCGGLGFGSEDLFAHEVAARLDAPTAVEKQERKTKAVPQRLKPHGKLKGLRQGSSRALRANYLLLWSGNVYAEPFFLRRKRRRYPWLPIHRQGICSKRNGVYRQTLRSGGLASQAWVEEVAEGVAEEVEGEDEEHDGEGGEEEEVGGVEEVGAGVVEHGSPAGCGWRDAEAEEAEGGFGEDGSGHADGGLDDEGLDDVGEDVACEEAEVGAAEGAARIDEFALFDGHDLGSDEAGVADPGGDGEGDDDIAEAGSEEGDEADGEEDAGEGEKGVADVDVEDGVGEAAVEAGERAGEDADEDGDGDDADGDEERDAGAEEDAREDVAAELVGAEGVVRAGGGEAVREVDLAGVGGGEQGSEDGGEGEEGEEEEADGGEWLGSDVGLDLGAGRADPCAMRVRGGAQRLGGRDHRIIVLYGTSDFTPPACPSGVNPDVYRS